MLAPHLAAIEQQEPLLPSRDAVHDARVACRRVRAGLRLSGRRDLDAGVKELQDALGKVRDLQLQVVWFEERDEDLRRRRAALCAKAEKALQLALRRWHGRTLPALISLDAKAVSRGHARKVVRKRVGRLGERLEAARARPSPPALHRARISVKQVRYLIELSESALPRKVVALSRDLKTLQASLGELHDTDVRVALLERKPALLREQQDLRTRLLKIAAAQLARWHGQKIAQRTRALLE
jgi:CHAD domain-containing protein